MRAFLLGLLLAACASPPKPAAPEDAEMRRSARVGRVAFNLERPDEAVTQYRAALSRAQASSMISPTKAPPPSGGPVSPRT